MASTTDRTLTDRVQKLEALLEVGKAMTAARDLDTLLGLILTAAQRMADADRCSLFLVDHRRRELWSRIAHGENNEIRFPLGQGIAGVVAETGEAIRLDDAYADPRFNRGVDQSTGYRTQSLLCCPMRSGAGEVVGVIQALNHLEGPFTGADEEMLVVLGGQAAAALESALLRDEIQRLFEGFVQASVVAIEARDPTTAGHSGRVADLTVGLARSLERATIGPFGGTHFSAAELHELRYASLLHDFGKVGVREAVLVKAEKLFPFELEQVTSRFEVIAARIEVESFRRRFDLMRNLGKDDAAVALLAEDQKLAESLAQLDDAAAFIRECNRPTVLARGGFERLQQISAFRYSDRRGASHPWLSENEVSRLSIPRGSLTELERKEIESHVVHTFRFLSQIPWTRDLQRIPSIAAAHHEKLDGTGYPGSLPDLEIPVQSKMMAIADIYDALTASDRPYKKAVPHTVALDILGKEAQARKVDATLLQVFIEAEIPQKALGIRPA